MTSLLSEFMDFYGLTLLSLERIYREPLKKMDGPLESMQVFRPFEEGFTEILDEIMAIPMPWEHLSKKLTRPVRWRALDKRRFSAYRFSGSIILFIPEGVMETMHSVHFKDSGDEEAAR